MASTSRLYPVRGVVAREACWIHDFRRPSSEIGKHSRAYQRGVTYKAPRLDKVIDNSHRALNYSYQQRLLQRFTPVDGVDNFPCVAIDRLDYYGGGGSTNSGTNTGIGSGSGSARPRRVQRSLPAEQRSNPPLT